jgi:hypothetical protein
MIFNIKLETKPGVPNKNGFTYSEKEYNKMINSERFKFLKENNMIYVVDREIPSYKQFTDTIDLTKLSVSYESIIGKVVEFKDDHTVDVDIIKPMYIDFVKENIDHLTLGMMYSCNVEDGKSVTDMKFISYYLMMS